MPEEKKDNMKGFWQTLVITIAVMLLAIFGVFVIHTWIVPNNTTLSDANLTIVLSFIGVLATFIVIGNFAQVSDIRHQMEQDIEDIKTKEIDPIKTGLDTTKRTVIGHTTSITDIGTRLNGIDTRIEGIDTIISSNKAANEKYSQEQVTSESIRLRASFKQYKRLVIETIFASYGDVSKVENTINKLMSPKEEDNFSVYVYRNGGNSTTITTKATLTEKGINFVNDAGESIAISSIRKIDGIEIKPQQLFKLYCLYQDTMTITMEDYSGNVGVARTDAVMGDGDDNRMDLNQ